ncbi:hypothetical protein EMIT07CA2_20627 [Brevibacillus sp. IT-7CA2]
MFAIALIFINRVEQWRENVKGGSQHEKVYIDPSSTSASSPDRLRQHANC